MMPNSNLKAPEAQVLPPVLVVDDDEQILKQMQWALAGEYHLITAADGPGAVETFRKQPAPVVLLDLGLPPRPREASEGLKVLEQLLAVDPLVKVVIVSGNSDRPVALTAVERGAYDIFPKPVDMDELKVVLKRVFQRLQLERESLDAQKRAADINFEDILGESAQMREILSTVRKVAPTDVPLLVSGESGTGKELVAKAVHNLSQRKEGPFVAINCAAVPENLLESELFGHERGSFTGASGQRKGRFEYAHGGTLFLDEIGELALPLQVKLLRFLQERVIERVGGREPIVVDCRIIAATNQDLSQSTRGGKFREDLFFRLAVVELKLPALRERGEDLVKIAEYFAACYAQELKKPMKRFSNQSLEALRRYPWPGNVRELQNRVKRAVVLAEGPVIRPTELQLELEGEIEKPPPRAGSSLKQAKESLERELVSQALAAQGGNISRAARSLGISRPTLYDLMAKYGLE